MGVQPWPEHQRPSRWIIDLAVQKTVALKGQVQERIKAGDTRFSDALELMTFLANLIGSEHIERFIPLADRENERDLKQQAARPSEPPPPDTGTGTREMPKFAPGQKPDPQPPRPVPARRARCRNSRPNAARRPPSAPSKWRAPSGGSGNAKPAPRTARQTTC